MLSTQKFNVFLRYLSIGAIALFGLGLLGACSSGGGDGSGGGGGSTSGVRSFGEIEKLGSIFVNGVKFETEGAQIIGMDNPTSGRVVMVEGQINADGLTGNATTVTAEDNLKGPLTSLTTDGVVTTGTIMGQTVIFEDNLTKFDDATTVMPTGDDLNKVFVVDGFARDDNKLQATFAAKLSDDLANFLTVGGILEVKGPVSELNATTFKVNGLTIVHGSAVLSDLPAGGLANGLMVEAKGTVFDTATNTLVATDIEGMVRQMGDDAAKVHMEGFVTNLNATAKTFTINGQQVNYTGATFRSGLEEDLLNGVKVEADGPLTNNVIMAVKVTFKASVRIEATVATVNAGAITLVGLPGITVMVHNDLTDGAAALATLAAGDGVKLRARLGAADLVATRLEEVTPEENRTEIRGPVTAFSAAGNTVTILGTVVVNTATITEVNFKDHDTVLGKASLFARLGEGIIVKARFRDGAWDQIELSD
jgi:hypothetical protein